MICTDFFEKYERFIPAEERGMFFLDILKVNTAGFIESLTKDRREAWEASKIAEARKRKGEIHDQAHD